MCVYVYVYVYAYVYVYVYVCVCVGVCVYVCMYYVCIEGVMTKYCSLASLHAGCRHAWL